MKTKKKMSNTESLTVELREAFNRLIAKHTGLEIRERDQASLSQKILSKMKDNKLHSPEKYYHLLNSNTLDSVQAWQDLVIDITNLESYFFRDKEKFNLLRNQILPELIQRKRYNKNIRICSAGCSTGEELYSLAILFKELLPDIEDWKLMILGVDINQSALEKAKIGIYRPWSFRNVDEETKRRYFQMVDNQYHIEPQIKKMVNFQTLNLVKDPFPQPHCELRDMDLILCRNVFIYFEQSAINKVLNKFNHALQPLGYLITGHAELHGQDLSQFQTKVFPESLVYQRYADDLVDTPLVFMASESNYFTVEQLSSELNHTPRESSLEQTNFNLYQVSLNLLKQLPPDTRISRLGNLTVAELILQLETALSLISRGIK